MKMFAVALALAAAGLSTTSQAAITVYTTQASFLAAVGTTGTDTFDNFSNTGTTPSPLTRTAGSFGYTATASTGDFYGAGSNADHWLSTDFATDTISFGAFTGGVRALGGLFFGSDINGSFAAGDVTLTATDASGTVTRTITGATTSSFLGFVSTGPLLGATLTAVQPGAGLLWSTANNLTLASGPAAGAVPEPASWAMMIGGFGLVGGSLRRRKATTTRVRFA